MHYVLSRLLLAVGWVIFISICIAVPTLPQLGWRVELMALCLGPAVMLAGVIMVRKMH